MYTYIFKCMCKNTHISEVVLVFLTRLVSLLGGGFCLRFGEPEIQENALGQ